MTATSGEPFSSIRVYSLRNRNGMEARITNFGGILVSLRVPDRKGNLSDVVLGYNRMDDYINAVDKPYFGAIIGRCGNRIARGKFELNGKSYQLATNNGNVNHLHGGITGFDKAVWKAEIASDVNGSGLVLQYRAKDGEENYPGNLDVTVVYVLTENNELEIIYRATTDQATPVNLTNHSYFNLGGEGAGTILDHRLQINAAAFTPVDETMIPTGEIRSVTGTPFDFTTAKPIGRDIEASDDQLRIGAGYDHNFVLNPVERENGLTRCARVYDPQSGRVLEVLTSEPGVQLYTANWLDGRLVGKSGKPYVRRGAFCLETQHFPDSPNHPGFPTIILQPGAVYHSRTLYRFSV